MKTKERILEIALRLFNSEGTKMVSTNHIAEAAKMSPGNLYYHYENKREIIREIFLIMMKEYDETDHFLEENRPCIDQMDVYVRKVLDVQWKYRFMQSELMTLVDHDPWLKERMVVVNHKQQKEFEKLIRQMITRNEMIDLPEETITFLARSSWFMSIFWQSYLGLSGEKITREKLGEGIQQIFFLIRPYLTAPEKVMAQISLTTILVGHLL